MLSAECLKGIFRGHYPQSKCFAVDWRRKMSPTRKIDSCQEKSPTMNTINLKMHFPRRPFWRSKLQVLSFVVTCLEGKTNSLHHKRSRAHWLTKYFALLQWMYFSWKYLNKRTPPEKYLRWWVGKRVGIIRILKDQFGFFQVPKSGELSRRRVFYTTATIQSL